MRRRLIKTLLAWLDIDLRLRTADRVVLEQVILPWLADRVDVRQVLFVGCEWYTRGYSRRFARQVYWTIDPDPEKAIFGAGRQHLVDTVAHVDRHFAHATLDVVVCNGVIGWGLDDPREIETAIAAIARVLRPRGLLLLGWNDVPDHRPVLPQCIQALGHFRPASIIPLRTTQLQVEGALRHTYNLYRKPAL